MAQADQWNTPLKTEHREDASHAPILTPDEARQGVVSGRVSMVLAISLTLAVVSFAVIFAAHV